MLQTFDDTADPSYGRTHLPLIRTEMKRQGLDGFIVPHEDEHQNEYLPDANERLAWATGFTGSAGAAVIYVERAAIFVDGRYALQVKDQVDPELFEIRDLVRGGVAAYLAETLKPGWSLGYDPKLHSPDGLALLRAAAEKASARLVAVESNPLDAAWGPDRPAQPAAPVLPHPLDVAGEPSESKRARIGASVAEAGAEVALITAPSSVAWLLNIRGADVIRTPLPLAQVLLEADGRARLFLDPAKRSNTLPDWLGEQVAVEAPEALPDALSALSGRSVLVDPALSSAWYFERLKAGGATIREAADPCALPRACKNPVELEGARRAHRRDAGALARFLHWLADEAERTLPDEPAIVEALEAFRAETGELRDLSFDTIAGAGPNGAIVHYRPTRRTARRLEPGSLLLVDSGAQYLDGTTDVTRTLAIGAPSAEMRRCFTLVLKGHLALSRVRFPPGVTGSALDVLARAALWSAGLDYDHGTGHGVGSFLGVHEGPQRISQAPSATALKPGMILSNEPGYYRTGAFGIRIENLMAVTEAETIAGGERAMHGFETLTLAPIDRRLVDRDALTAEERAQLDAYHARVVETVAPSVPGAVADWLAAACAPI